MTETMKMLFVPSLLCLVTLGLLAGCDREEPAPAPAPAATALPADLILEEPPAGAKDVAEVKRDVGDGEEVVVRGRVGGDAEPFAENFAAVQLVDLSVRSCAEIEGDSCATPWDYCCETDVKKSSLMVQVVDESGKPLKSSLKGAGGMKGLSEVVVKGRLQKLPGSDAVVINASGLHVNGG